MTDQELEILLTEKCRTLDLTRTAFANLKQIFKDNNHDKYFLGDFEQNEIKVIFERFDFQIKERKGDSIIKTRIGLYIEDKDCNWLNNLKPIGYYELDTEFNGAFIDDWLVIDNEKYLKDK